MAAASLAITDPGAPVEQLLHAARSAFAANDPQRALAPLQRMLELAPEDPRGSHLLGRAYAHGGRYSAAATAYNLALRQGVKSPDLFNDLGNALAQLGQLDAACRAYGIALKMRPDLAGLYHNLAKTQLAAGDRDAAHETFTACLRGCPGDPVASHMLISLAGGNAPSRAAESYVESTFDSFAATFDRTLVGRLKYCGPEHVAAALKSWHGEPDATLRLLDAGCGTGLCGPLLRPFASVLEGVDLSGEMLKRAEMRGGYDRLEKADLTGFLASVALPYDAIVAADVLIYFGDLTALFSAAASALRARGAFIGTVELSAANDFVLTPSGRYAHSRGCLESAASAAGLAVHASETFTLRKEHGQPVEALLFTFTKSTDQQGVRT